MYKNEKFLDLIVQKRDESLKEKIGFSSNIFMVFGLPTHKLKGNPRDWIKETSLCKLTITRHLDYEIPYGCYARMNQIFIDSEVRTKNTNIIDVGRSFREYTHKLGYKDGKANRSLLNQLVNYITSVIRVEPKENLNSRIMGIQTLVARAWDVHFSTKDPEQLMISKGQIVLDENYAKYIHKHSVPLDMNVITCFKQNPLALDFYRFLAYRNNNLRKAVSFPDRLLFEQLGTEVENDRIIRMKLKNLLRAIQMYWPVKAKFEDEYFELQPSPPAVQKRLPSSKNIKILNTLIE